MYELTHPTSYAVIMMAQFYCKAALHFRNNGKNLEVQTQDSQLNLVMVSPENDEKKKPNPSQKISRCHKSMQIPAKWMWNPESLLFQPPIVVKPLE